MPGFAVLPPVAISIRICASGAWPNLHGFGQRRIFGLSAVAEIRRTTMEAANLATPNDESDTPPIFETEVDRLISRVRVRLPASETSLQHLR